MAHLAKYTRTEIGALTRHFERYKNKDGEYLKFGNQEIDTSKTHLNYNLAEEKNQLDFIKERTEEVRCLNRKDVNVMCSWIITRPEGIKDSEQEYFFQEAYIFLREKYGKENVISSFVHLDETTPHMHFAFIPVVIDKKRGDLKVSAKELITRKHLQDFHPELEKYMEYAFGFNRDIGILNDATKDGNKTVEELKRETSLERVKIMEKQVSDMVRKYKETLALEESKLIPLEMENISLKVFLDELDKNYNSDYQLPNSAEIKERGILNKEKYISMPLKEYRNIVKANDVPLAAKIGIQSLDDEYERIRNSYSYQHIQDLEENIDSLKDENKDLKQNVKSLKDNNQNLGKEINRLNQVNKSNIDSMNNTIDMINDVLGSNSELYKLFLDTKEELEMSREMDDIDLDWDMEM